MKVLIIEDNEKLAQSLKRGLEQEGIAADYLLDGESGQRRIESKNSYKSIYLGIHRFCHRRDADGTNDLPHQQWSECYFVKTSLRDCYRYFDFIRLEHRQ